MEKEEGVATTPKGVIPPQSAGVPLNLPAVLQDRPRGRHPPPVPPRSPRGGRTGHGGASSIVRGGLTYLKINPPIDVFHGSSPHFAPFCSPSIGIAGYDIWHAMSTTTYAANPHRHGRHPPAFDSLHANQSTLPTRHYPSIRTIPENLLKSHGIKHYLPHHHNSTTSVFTDQEHKGIKTAKGVWNVIKTASHPSSPETIFKSFCHTSQSSCSESSHTPNLSTKLFPPPTFIIRKHTQMSLKPTNLKDCPIHVAKCVRPSVPQTMMKDDFFKVSCFYSCASSHHIQSFPNLEQQKLFRKVAAVATPPRSSRKLSSHSEVDMTNFLMPSLVQSYSHSPSAYSSSPSLPFTIMSHIRNVQ